MIVPLVCSSVPRYHRIDYLITYFSKYIFWEVGKNWCGPIIINFLSGDLRSYRCNFRVHHVIFLRAVYITGKWYRDSLSCFIHLQTIRPSIPSVHLPIGLNNWSKIYILQKETYLKCKIIHFRCTSWLDVPVHLNVLECTSTRCTSWLEIHCLQQFFMQND